MLGAPRLTLRLAYTMRHSHGRVDVGDPKGTMTTVAKAHLLLGSCSLVFIDY